MLRNCLWIIVLAPTVAVAQSTDESNAGKTPDQLATIVKADTGALLRQLKEALKQQDERLVRIGQAQIVRRGSSDASRQASNAERTTFQNKQEKEAAIKNSEATIAQLKKLIEKYENGKEFFYGPLNLPTRIGRFGALKDGSANVVKVIDSGSMLISYDPSPLANENPQSTMLMVKGVSTRGADEGSRIELPQVFEVTGTETYTQADGGDTTVFVIKPIDIKKINSILRTSR